MKLDLTQKTSQTLAITQQMELSIRILEMDTLELTEYIQDFSLENPTVDLEAEVNAESVQLQREKKLEWLDALSKNDKQNRGYYDPSENPLEKMAAAPEFETLAEHLLHQLPFGKHDRMYQLAARLIGYLDEDGYLRAEAHELCKTCACTWEELNDAISCVQGMEPAGVGARDMVECLLLQLPVEDEIPRRIVRSHLDDLAGDRISKMAKALGVDPKEAREAAKRIRTLNPRPGSGFGHPDPTHYVTPNVVVTKFPDHYYVLPYEFSYPTLSLNQSYIDEMLQTGDPAVKDYIETKVKQAEWVQQCITNRTKTLLQVSKAIVARQEPFFFGNRPYLGVLCMSDIAGDLGLHESTISRAVKNKYLQCSHGTFPLKYFFVQGTRTSGGGGASSHELKGKIRELIDKEDKGSPLSDQQLADALEAEGLHISRRAVAKYRDELLIPKSTYRRVGK